MIKTIFSFFLLFNQPVADKAQGWEQAPQSIPTYQWSA